MSKVIFIVGLLLLQNSIAAASTNVVADVEAKNISEGAYLFRRFCSLCHGVNGMGEGPLALVIDDYPMTNLLTSNKANSREDILEIIKNGSQTNSRESFMPPWNSAFNEEELNQLTDFVVFLKNDPAEGTKLLRNQSNRIEPNIRHGELLYKTYCTRCHGDKGKGDGKMARIVKSPPPFDLTKSRQNDSYLELIITTGGEIMQRSPQMPPWGDELSRHDILSVIQYIKSLRE